MTTDDYATVLRAVTSAWESYAWTLSDDRIQDLQQEVAVQVLEAQQRTEIRDLGAYSFGVARNIIADWSREDGIVSVTEDAPDPREPVLRAVIRSEGDTRVAANELGISRRQVQRIVAQFQDPRIPRIVDPRKDERGRWKPQK